MAVQTSVMSNTPCLGGQLRVEDDLEQQVAELAGELRRRAALERVVDLVRLLEEVVAQRGVGLLPVPRAAVGLAEPGRDPGHAPRRGEVGDGRDRRRGTAVSFELVGGQLADRRPVRDAEAADRMVGRIEASEDARSGPTPCAVAAGQGRRSASRSTPARHRARPARSAAGPSARSGSPTSRSATTTAMPGRGIEAPPEPSLGEERVEHRPAARADVSSCCRTR